MITPTIHVLRCILEQVDWRRFSNTFINSYAYMRGPLKIQVNWPKKSIVAENSLENTKKNVFEIQY